MNEIEFFDISGKSDEGTFVYVLQFSSGVVKVGYTANPAQRLKQHADTAQQHGGDITKHWVSQPHAQANENERRLIAFCADRAPRVTGNEKAGEYFTGLDFEEVLAYAKSLPYVPGEPQQAPSDEQLKQWTAQWRQSMENAFGRRLLLPPRPQIPSSWDSPNADPVADLTSQILDLPLETVEAFDAEDRLAFNQNLIDSHHAKVEIEALEHFLAAAHDRLDVSLFDARYALSDALAAKHGVLRAVVEDRMTATRMAEVRQQLRAESELPPDEALDLAMRRFSNHNVREFERDHDMSWSSPDWTFALHRGGIRSDRTLSGHFRTVLTSRGGRYAAKVSDVAQAMGMTEAAFFCEYADNEDDFPVIAMADRVRGVFDLELILCGAVRRIAQAAGFGVPLATTEGGTR